MEEFETVRESLRRLGYLKFWVKTFSALTQRLRKFQKSEYTYVQLFLRRDVEPVSRCVILTRIFHIVYDSNFNSFELRVVK